MSHQRVVTLVLGAQWGDEGKGKLIDVLATNFNIVARCQGGNNAGHTVYADGKHYSFHILPSGIIRPNVISIIGNGCVIHIEDLFNEISVLQEMGITGIEERLLISDRAHLGTTKKGIGPCYSTKAARIGIRIGDLIYCETSEFVSKFEALYDYFSSIVPINAANMEQDLENHLKRKTQIKRLICDTSKYVNNAIANSQTVMVEGANGALLDIDFGTYPFVTSSSCSVGGACTGLGISPLLIKEIIGVVKAYTTRVGDGPFPTENNEKVGELLRQKGKEYGVTTGRPRRCGWLDTVVLKHSVRVNGFTALNLTKLDVLNEFEEIQIGTTYWHEGIQCLSPPSSVEVLAKVSVDYTKFKGWKCDISQCKTYEELPLEARVYIEFIEKCVAVPIRWIGIGPERTQMIFR